MAVRRFVITVDDPGGLVQDTDMLERAVRFFDSRGVPVTFFVVPRSPDGFRIDRQEPWLSLARAALATGHDAQLHGLEHGRYEFGPYAPCVLALGGPEAVRRFEEQERPQLEPLWRRDLFAEKLRIAIGIFESAFGRRPLAFRGGAASHSAELYQAMGDVGLHYDSSKILDPRGWMYILGRYDDPGDWDPAVRPGPYRVAEQVTELPIVSEYAWYLTPEKIEPHLALAREDMQRVFALDGVFLLVCHVQCVGAEDDHARTLLGRLITLAREEHDVQFQTVTQLVDAIESSVVRTFET